MKSRRWRDGDIRVPVYPVSPVLISQIAWRLEGLIIFDGRRRIRKELAPQR